MKFKCNQLEVLGLENVKNDASVQVKVLCGKTSMFTSWQKYSADDEKVSWGNTILIGLPEGDISKEVVVFEVYIKGMFGSKLVGKGSQSNLHLLGVGTSMRSSISLSNGAMLVLHVELTQNNPPPPVEAPPMVDITANATAGIVPTDSGNSDSDGNLSTIRPPSSAVPPPPTRLPPIPPGAVVPPRPTSAPPLPPSPSVTSVVAHQKSDSDDDNDDGEEEEEEEDDDDDNEERVGENESVSDDNTESPLSPTPPPPPSAATPTTHAPPASSPLLTPIALHRTENSDDDDDDGWSDEDNTAEALVPPPPPPAAAPPMTPKQQQLEQFLENSSRKSMTSGGNGLEPGTHLESDDSASGSSSEGASSGNSSSNTTPDTTPLGKGISTTITPPPPGNASGHIMKPVNTYESPESGSDGGKDEKQTKELDQLRKEIMDLQEQLDSQLSEFESAWAAREADLNKQHAEALKAADGIATARLERELAALRIAHEEEIEAVSAAADAEIQFLEAKILETSSSSSSSIADATTGNSLDNGSSVASASSASVSGEDLRRKDAEIEALTSENKQLAIQSSSIAAELVSKTEEVEALKYQIEALNIHHDQEVESITSAAEAEISFLESKIAAIEEATASLPPPPPLPLPPPTPTVVAHGESIAAANAADKEATHQQIISLEETVVELHKERDSLQLAIDNAREDHGRHLRELNALIDASEKTEIALNEQVEAVAALREQLHESEQNQGGLSSALELAQQERDRLTLQCGSLEQQLAQAVAQVREMQQINSTATAATEELQASESAIATANEKWQHLEADLAGQVTDNAQLAERLESALEGNARLEREMAALQSRMVEMQCSAAIATENLEQATSQVAALNIQIEEAATYCQELEQQMETLVQNNQAKRDKDQQEATEQQAQQQQHIQELEKDMAHLNDALRNEQESSEQLRQEVAELKRAAAAAAIAVDDQNERRREMADDSNTSSSSPLDAEKEALMAQLESLRKQLEESKEQATRTRSRSKSMEALQSAITTSLVRQSLNIPLQEVIRRTSSSAGSSNMGLEEEQVHFSDEVKPLIIPPVPPSLPSAPPVTSTAAESPAARPSAVVTTAHSPLSFDSRTDVAAFDSTDKDVDGVKVISELTELDSPVRTEKPLSRTVSFSANNSESSSGSSGSSRHSSTSFKKPPVSATVTGSSDAPLRSSIRRQSSLPKLMETIPSDFSFFSDPSASSGAAARTADEQPEQEPDLGDNDFVNALRDTINGGGSSALTLLSTPSPSPARKENILTPEEAELHDILRHRPMSPPVAGCDSADNNNNNKGYLIASTESFDESKSGSCEHQSPAPESSVSRAQGPSDPSFCRREVLLPPPAKGIISSSALPAGHVSPYNYKYKEAMQPQTHFAYFPYELSRRDYCFRVHSLVAQATVAPIVQIFHSMDLFKHFSSSSSSSTHSTADNNITALESEHSTDPCFVLRLILQRCNVSIGCNSNELQFSIRRALRLDSTRLSEFLLAAEILLALSPDKIRENSRLGDLSSLFASARTVISAVGHRYDNMPDDTARALYQLQELEAQAAAHNTLKEERMLSFGWDWHAEEIVDDKGTLHHEGEGEDKRSPLKQLQQQQRDLLPSAAAMMSPGAFIRQNAKHWTEDRLLVESESVRAQIAFTLTETRSARVQFAVALRSIQRHAATYRAYHASFGRFEEVDAIDAFNAALDQQLSLSTEDLSSSHTIHQKEGTGSTGDSGQQQQQQQFHHDQKPMVSMITSALKELDMLERGIDPGLAERGWQDGRQLVTTGGGRRESASATTTREQQQYDNSNYNSDNLHSTFSGVLDAALQLVQTSSDLIDAMSQRIAQLGRTGSVSNRKEELLRRREMEYALEELRQLLLPLQQLTHLLDMTVCEEFTAALMSKRMLTSSELSNLVFAMQLPFAAAAVSSYTHTHNATTEGHHLHGQTTTATAAAASAASSAAAAAAVSTTTSVASLLLQIADLSLLKSVYASWPQLCLSCYPDATAEEEEEHQPDTAMLGSSSLGMNNTTLTSTNSINSGYFNYSDTQIMASSSSLNKRKSVVSKARSSKEVLNSFNAKSKSLRLSRSAIAEGNAPHQQQELRLKKRSSSAAVANRYMRFVSDIALDGVGVDFDPEYTSSLRAIGFSLAQLSASGKYAPSHIIAAGFPLPLLLQHLNDIPLPVTVKDLRRAGYSVPQLCAAGFDVASLRAGGFDDYIIFSGGQFSPAEMRKAGCDVQRFALMQLFESTGGRYWRNRDKGTWGVTRSLAEWHGLELDGSGNVVRIDLRGNYLQGPIPKAISLLTSLQYLDLSNNQISGSLPGDVPFHKLTALREFWLVGNTSAGGGREGGMMGGLVTDRTELQGQMPRCRIRL